METKLIARVNNVDIVSISEEQFIPIRPICEALGIDDKAQRNRIERDEILSSTGVIMTSVGADGKQRDMMCLPIEFIFGWLFSIDTSRVNEEAKHFVVSYKKECYHALFKHFTAPQTFLKQKQAIIEEMVKEYQSCQQNFKDAKNKMNEAKTKLNNIMSYTIEDWEANNRQLEIGFTDVDNQ